MSNTENMLNVLKIRSMEAQMNYLKALSKRQDEIIVSQGAELKRYRTDGMHNTEELNERALHIRNLNNRLVSAERELNNEKQTVEFLRKEIDDLKRESLRFLKFMPMEVIFPVFTDRQKFVGYCDAGEHVEAIKLLRNSSPVDMGLRAAKDLYEGKYRNWELYPQGHQSGQPAALKKPVEAVIAEEPNLFKVGDKVICIDDKDSLMCGEYVTQGQIYTISKIRADEVCLDGRPISWLSSRFKLYLSKE